MNYICLLCHDGLGLCGVRRATGYLQVRSITQRTVLLEIHIYIYICVYVCHSYTFDWGNTVVHNRQGAQRLI